MTLRKKIDIVALLFLLTYFIIILFLFFRFEVEKIGNNNYYFQSGRVEQFVSLDNKVRQLVQMSELHDESVDTRIFLTANSNEFFMAAPSAARAFGVSYLFINLIIIASSSLEEDMVFANREENNVRALSSTIAHEIIHVLIRKKYGTIKSLFFPKWKIEGYAEYIANDSSFDEELGMELFCSAKKDDSSSYEYFKYRKYITYLMNEGYSFGEIIEKDFELSEIDQKTRAAICPQS